MRFTTALSCGAAVALAGRGPVYAQDIAPHQFSAITAQQQLPAEGESDLQEVVVTGYRQSLELAQKKNATPPRSSIPSSRTTLASFPTPTRRRHCNESPACRSAAIWARVPPS